MSWLFLAALVIIWAACILPMGRRRSPNESVQEFERGLDLLAETHGRWIVAPRKGAQFIGTRNRARARACARRRRVFFTLTEALGLTFLMGLFPPLRPMWYAAAAFFGMLVLYVAILVSVRRNEREIRQMRERFVKEVDAPGGASRAALTTAETGHGIYERHVAVGRGRATRPTLNGLSVIDSGEVHVVVRQARRLQPAVR